MKRLGTLVMAIILITGCNAMRPNIEETELLWEETEKNIQKWAISTKAEISPAEKTLSTSKPTVEIPQKKPTSTEEPTLESPMTTPSPKPGTTEPESTVQPEQATPQQAEQPKETPVMIDWPYPAITCPPEPEPTEPPTDPTPEPTVEPQTGYAQCSCGARLIPEEVLPHMKAHAMNSENHSYRAY